jgi:DNA uptake protein ComE-like DNA-binding protein
MRFPAETDGRGLTVEVPPWLDVGRKRRPGFMWALVPLVTLGVGAAPAFFYVALRYRRPRFLVAAAAYALVLTGAITLIAISQAVTIGIGVSLLLVCTGLATAHALAVRRDVAVEVDDNDRHLAAARERLRRRAEARKLAVANQTLANELGIGRPDLITEFDDGGLVDVNHSPAQVLADLPGIDMSTATRIVSIRTDLGGFSSVDELSVAVDLPPSLLDGIADRLIFLRP